MSNLAEKETRRSEEHTSELQSRLHLVCRLLLEKKNKATRAFPTEPPTGRSRARPFAFTGRQRRCALVRGGPVKPPMKGELGGFDSFFFNDTATTEIYPLSLHDALPISGKLAGEQDVGELRQAIGGEGAIAARG